MLPVGMRFVCLCVYMGVWSMEERNDVTTKKGRAAPQKTTVWPRKPCPSFPIEQTPDTIAIAISRQHEVNPFQSVWIRSVPMEILPSKCVATKFQWQIISS